MTPTEIRSRLTFLQSQLTALAVAMMQARARGDEVAVENMRPTYRKLAAEAALLRSGVSAKEMPSDLMIQLDTFGDKVLEVGQAIGEIPKGIGAAFKSLPVILGAVAVLALLGFVLYTRKGK